jgi:hypothetical protein
MTARHACHVRVVASVSGALAVRHNAYFRVSSLGLLGGFARSDYLSVSIAIPLLGEWGQLARLRESEASQRTSAGVSRRSARRAVVVVITVKRPK